MERDSGWKRGTVYQHIHRHVPSKDATLMAVDSVELKRTCDENDVMLLSNQ